LHGKDLNGSHAERIRELLSELVGGHSA